jgi:hypothetical protein
VVQVMASLLVNHDPISFATSSGKQFREVRRCFAADELIVVVVDELGSNSTENLLAIGLSCAQTSCQGL